MFNPIEIIADSMGIDLGIGSWFAVTILGYLFFGFGGCAFDFACMRFRDTSSGRFVKWEIPLIVGTLGDVLMIKGMADIMSIWEMVEAIVGLLICIGLTVMLGGFTRNH